MLFPTLGSTDPRGTTWSMPECTNGTTARTTSTQSDSHNAMKVTGRCTMPLGGKGITLAQCVKGKPLH